MWLHPDVVGIQDLGRKWESSVVHCDKYVNSRLKLWSFEVKTSVDNSSVREAFFQTVSNSTWANFSYLVIAEIKDNKVMEELQTLSRLYGIGVIELNVNNPKESKIKISSQERKIVDWNMANRIASVNTDFRKYTELVMEFYKLDGEIKVEYWDYVPQKEEENKKINNKIREDV